MSPSDPPREAAQAAPSRKAQQLKADAKPAPHPEPGPPDPVDEPVRDQNDSANVQGSVDIGGHPERLSRSQGRRQSDQG